jgi:hypothetical protein
MAETIELSGVTYEYTYKSIDLNRITLLMGTDKQAEAMEYCIGLLKVPIPEKSEADSVLRSVLGQAIFMAISAKFTALKK